MFIHCRELKGNSRTVGQSSWWSNMGGLEAEKNREETDGTTKDVLRGREERLRMRGRVCMRRH